MKKKPVIVVLIFAVFTAAVWFISTRFVYLDGEGKTGDTKAELQLLGMAVQVAVQRELIAAADWDRISDMQTLAPHITPLMDLGEQALIDPWGNQFILEKREESDQIILTIRSSRGIPKKWYQSHEKVLGIEISISRGDGNVAQVKDLWRD
jgi:hypothetical protein